MDGNREKIIDLISRLETNKPYHSDSNEIEKILELLNNYLQLPEKFSLNIETDLSFKIDEIIRFKFERDKIVNNFYTFVATTFIFSMFLWLFLKAFYVEFDVNINYNKYLIIIYNLFLSKKGRLIGILLIFSISVILFYLKIKQQFYYGLLETNFALITCYVSMTSVQNSVAKQNFTFYIFFSVMSTIYLIIRGLNNISDGWKKPFLGKEVILNL